MQSVPVTLDPERREDARQRAADLEAEASYYESRARAARSQAALLGRTWGFEVEGGGPGDSVRCTPLPPGTLGAGVDEAVEQLRQLREKEQGMRFDPSNPDQAGDWYANQEPTPAVVLASEADYEDGVRCVVMPCCGFTFDAGHADDRIEPARYSCPICA